MNFVWRGMNVKLKQSSADVVFDGINYFFLSVMLLVVAYPLYFIVIASFSNPEAVNSGNVWFWPKQITFEGYQRIFKDPLIFTAYKNTVIYATLGTVINVILTMMAAYPLAQKSFSGKKAILGFLMVTMYFNGGLIPTYLLVKDLGLVNNWIVMILLGAVSVWNIIIAKTFLQNNIPADLYEAAFIDGCSHMTFFIKIVIPLSKSIIAVLILYYGVGHWNDFMKALIYLRSEQLYPLQLVLRSIFNSVQTQDQMMGDVLGQFDKQRLGDLIKYGMIIVASVPVLALYPFLQKYFVQGIMIGSLKG